MPLTPVDPPRTDPVHGTPMDHDDDQLAEAMRRLIQRPDYPCLGARSVFRRDRATLAVYPELGSDATAQLLLDDIRQFASEMDLADGFASFVAMFRTPEIRDEEHFEELLWAQLGAIHRLDDDPWASEVAADPTDTRFAFSIGGTAFFVVGMHPCASRRARRTAVPTLVFNLHGQFEQLRASGSYPRLRDRIRSRDRRMQGTVNPMVDDHGHSSEARQYSGRHVPAGWRAPFDPVEQTDRAGACPVSGQVRR